MVEYGSEWNAKNNESQNTEPKKNKKINKYIFENVLNEIINKLKKNNNCKNKNTEIFKDIYNNNRNTIKLYHDLYQKYLDKELTDSELNEYGRLCDINKSRRNKLLKTYSLIYKNSVLYNSFVIFPYYTFEKVHVDDINLLIEKIKIDEIENVNWI
jgi:hypothetical protein